MTHRPHREVQSTAATAGLCRPGRVSCRQSCHGAGYSCPLVTTREADLRAAAETPKGLVPNSPVVGRPSRALAALTLPLSPGEADIFAWHSGRVHVSAAKQPFLRL